MHTAGRGVHTARCLVHPTRCTLSGCGVIRSAFNALRHRKRCGTPFAKHRSMKRICLAVLLASWVLPGCASANEPSARAPRSPGARAAGPRQLDGPLPAGVYEVTDQVLVNTCGFVRTLPPTVAALKRFDPYTGAAELNVPYQRYGTVARTPRNSFNMQGHKGGGVSKSRGCPGVEVRHRVTLENVTPTSFQLRLHFNSTPLRRCPLPTAGGPCEMAAIYTYRLVQPACSASCQGFVSGMRDKDVPLQGVPISCDCSKRQLQVPWYQRTQGPRGPQPRQ